LGFLKENIFSLGKKRLEKGTGQACWRPSALNK
jgi:hypothetical protein